jgi:hypothetical protein
MFRVGVDSQLSALASTGAFQIIDQSNNGFYFTEYNNTDGAVFRCRRALGTTAAPLPVTSGSVLTSYRGFGYTGIGFQRAAGVEIRAAEDFSITKNGTSLAFQVTNTGTTSYYDAMTILNGNVGIGTVSPQYTLDVMSATGSAPLRIRAGVIDALIVNSTGNVSVGGDGTFNGNVTMSGNASALSFQTTSDYRIKENVRGLSGNITVDSLKPIQYFNTRARRLDIGFLAHEVQEDFPFLVEGEKDGENLQTLNYIGLVGVLVKEIQELKARVAVLEIGGTGGST